jgi:hypothetical protein
VRSIALSAAAGAIEVPGAVEIGHLWYHRQETQQSFEEKQGQESDEAESPPTTERRDDSP